MAVPAMEADENVRILRGGASMMRSRHFGAASPFWKLILVRPRTNDCCPSSEVSTQVKLVLPSHLRLSA
jgi:hypothetical protein